VISFSFVNTLAMSVTVLFKNWDQYMDHEILILVYNTWFFWFIS